jgi:hypothetical protein
MNSPAGFEIVGEKYASSQTITETLFREPCVLAIALLLIEIYRQ